MADGADARSKLDKLARLKNLKSGLKAAETASRDDDGADTLQSMLVDDVEPPKPAIDKPVEPPKAAAAKKAPPIDTDDASLSSYFEALGIVPDNADGPARPAPKPFTSADETYARASGKRDAAKSEEKGREVDIRDRWADPVREDETFLSSFAAGEKTAPTPEPEAEDDDLSLDSIIGSFDDDEEAPSIEIENPVPLPEEEDEPETPSGLDVEVDIEAFEAEIALSAQEEEEAVTKSAPEPEAPAEPDQPLTITFDESRATLLAHVSKQMGCSIDDVVVTAVDWYLDALFGEEDPNVAAQGD